MTLLEALQVIHISILFILLFVLIILLVLTLKKGTKNSTNYTYFVSYTFAKNGKSGVGSNYTTIDRAITTMEIVKSTEALLRKNIEADILVLTNFILLREE